LSEEQLLSFLCVLGVVLVVKLDLLLCKVWKVKLFTSLRKVHEVK